MFPRRSLILAILRVAIFSIEVPERERVKRRAVCNRGGSRGCILLWALLSLSLWHRSAENGNPKNFQNWNDRWGISFYVFYLLWLLFHLIMETFFSIFSFFLLYMATLFPPLFFRFICYFLNAYLNHVFIQKYFLLHTWFTYRIYLTRPAAW